MREYKKPNELLFVPTAAVTLDNIRGYRFRGATNLAALFEHLELWQVSECHAMHSNRYFSRQLPNLKISIAHTVSRIRVPHPASQLVFNQNRSSLRASALVHRH